MRKMQKMRNWAQLIFVAWKMRKFAPTRKPVALETLVSICRSFCCNTLNLSKNGLVDIEIVLGRSRK